MNTAEVARYLDVQPRKIYELVGKGEIPCSRVTGKWLFPKSLIDLWVLQGNIYPHPLPAAPPPPVIAGSHDPLLAWAAGESGCELALLSQGSRDGLQRLAAQQAVVAGMHLLDADSGDYNLPAVQQTLRSRPVVVIHWAWRRQGLLLPQGNPRGVTGLADVADRQLRFAHRQAAAGSRLLLEQLLAKEGRTPESLEGLARPAHSETEVALTVADGRADAGLAIEAAARQQRLDFLPLWRERFDLALTRRDYFEAPFQTLLAFSRTPDFAERAAGLGGYDVAETGRVLYNAP